MLEVLQNHTFPGKAKVLTNWNLFLKSCMIRMEIRHLQFGLASPQESGCIRLLRSLLFDVDTKYLLTKPDDMTRYVECIQYMINLTEKFDPYRIHKPLYNTFYNNSGLQPRTHEFVVSVNYHAPLMTLPMDTGWENWQSVNPVHILFTDSKKIPNSLIGDAIKLKDRPFVSVIGLNLPILILKWVNYIKSTSMQELNDPDIFLHKYVIDPIYDQLLDLWVMNLLTAVVDHHEQMPTREIAEMYTPSWLSTGACANGLGDIYSFISQYKAGNFSIGTVMSTPFFASGKCLYDKIHDYTEHELIPELRQYKYIKLLCEMQYMDFIIRMLRMQPNSVDSKYVFTKLSRKLINYRSMKLRSMLNCEEVNTYIDQKLNLYDALNG